MGGEECIGRYIYLMCKAWGSYRHRTFKAQKRAILGHLTVHQRFPVVPLQGTWQDSASLSPKTVVIL